MSFVLNKKVHIKGFSFERQNRAFEVNKASDFDRIYGDSYKISEYAVTDIGNNVTLEFDDIDFNEECALSIEICGNSPIDKNTMHLLFSSKDGDVRQTVDFSLTDGYKERRLVTNGVRPHLSTHLSRLPIRINDSPESIFCLKLLVKQERRVSSWYGAVMEPCMVVAYPPEGYIVNMRFKIS